VRQVRVVPKADQYVLEVVYEAQEQRAEGLDPELLSRLTERVNALAALTSNKPRFVPRLVSGKPVKAMNQLYNKQREHIQKHLAEAQRPTLHFSPPGSDHDEAQSARAAVVSTPPAVG
jgi:putative transposase